MIRVVTITGLSNASAAGTFNSPHPVAGEILEIRDSSGGWNAAGDSADVTFTRLADGGTILALSNVSGPWQYQPRQVLHTVTGGTTTYAAGNPNAVISQAGVPCADYIRCVLAQGGTSQNGTVYIHYRC